MPTLNIVMFIKSKWLYCIYQLIQEDVSPTCSKSLLHLKDITCSVATSFYKMSPLSLERWAITMIAMGSISPNQYAVYHNNGLCKITCKIIKLMLRAKARRSCDHNITLMIIVI